MREELLEYYERELTYLRQMGAEFARKYPRVAGRLLLDLPRPLAFSATATSTPSAWFQTRR